MFDAELIRVVTRTSVCNTWEHSRISTRCYSSVSIFARSKRLSPLKNGDMMPNHRSQAGKAAVTLRKKSEMRPYH